MINETNLLLWCGIGIAIVFILLIVYLYLKEAENAKRTRRYEKSIEELNKEVYRLQKRINEQESGLEHFKTGIKAQIYQDVRLEMKSLLDSNLHTQVMPMKAQTESLNSQWNEYKNRFSNLEDLENKILQLEGRLKELVYTPSNPTDIDEGRIIAMFKDGWSIDSIAKELRVGKGEVEFTLKFANLNKG